MDTEEVPMLKLDASFLAVRLETALEVMEDIRADQKTEETSKSAISQAFENTVVVTRYNNKIYKVKQIAFDKDPQSSF